MNWLLNGLGPGCRDSETLKVKVKVKVASGCGPGLSWVLYSAHWVAFHHKSERSRNDPNVGEGTPKPRTGSNLLKVPSRVGFEPGCPDAQPRVCPRPCCRPQGTSFLSAPLTVPHLHGDRWGVSAKPAPAGPSPPVGPGLRQDQGLLVCLHGAACSVLGPALSQGPGPCGLFISFPRVPRSGVRCRDLRNTAVRLSVCHSQNVLAGSLQIWEFPPQETIRLNWL